MNRSVDDNVGMGTAKEGQKETNLCNIQRSIKKHFQGHGEDRSPSDRHRSVLGR